MASPEVSELGGENEPLLRRVSVRDEQRLRFEQAQRQAVGGVAMGSRGFLANIVQFIVMLLVIAVLGFSLYIYFGSLWVIVFHLDRPCDQPLGAWLVGWMITPTLHSLIDPPLSREHGAVAVRQHQRARHRRQVFIHGAWFTLGYVWINTCRTCQQTNMVLFNWVQFVIQIYVAVIITLLFAPVLLALGYMVALRILQALIDYGWISNPHAASKETIDLLEVVPFDAKQFSAEDGGVEECCCCAEAFDSTRPIVRTSCGHYYHQACLSEWLRLAKTCPLCRCDLDAAVAGHTTRLSTQVREPAMDLEAAMQPSQDISMQGERPAGVETDEEMARRLQGEEFQLSGAV